MYDYEWLGTWKDESGKIYTTVDIAAYKPTSNKKFVAQYNAILHPYTITLRDYNGVDIDHTIGT
jgi:hypothetical protein